MPFSHIYDTQRERMGNSSGYARDIVGHQTLGCDLMINKDGIWFAKFRKCAMLD